MKLKKRIVVLATALAVALTLPQAALATEVDAAKATSETTTTSTEAPDEKPSENVPMEEPESVQDTWDNTWGVLTEHSVLVNGSAVTQGVTKNTSGITLEFYFNRSDSNWQAVPNNEKNAPLSVKLKDGGAFSAQNLTVETVGKHILRIGGLKYTNTNSSRFEATISGADFPDMVIGEPIPELYPEEKDDVVVGPDGEVSAAASNLIVKSSSIGADVVDAGAEFQLSLTVYATASGKKDINDVIVSVAPAEGLTITSGGSTEYIGTMKPGSSKTVSFPMRALPDFVNGVSTVSVTVTGSGAEGTPTTVSVPVRQPDRFEISRVDVPDSMMVGDENVASVYFVNKGKNAINNVTVQMTGTNLQQSTQNQYVGNLAAGTEDSVDLDLSAVEAGNIEGTITVSYEAPSGDIVTLTEKISVPVEEYFDQWAGQDGMEGMDGMEEPVDGMPTSRSLAPWQIALIVVVAVAAVVVVVLVLRKRAAKKKAAQEESDEDF